MQPTIRNQSHSKAAFARAMELFPGGVNSPVRAFKSVHSEPFVVSHAQGPYLYDVDGNRYIDYVLSWGPLVLGHAHPTVVREIEKQASRGTSYGACAEIEVALAEQIVSLVPSMEMIRFVNSGTEAAMSAIRIARGFTGKNKIIKFSGCYHGHADALLAKAGSGIATLGIPECAGIPAATTADTITVQYNNFSQVEEAFRTYSGDIAALILEPIVGNSGFIKPLPDFLSNLRKICTENKVLLIFDEVMTGFRVHLGGAQALYNITPDITLLGKVIGGGLPVGAFGGRKDIMSILAPLGPVYQAGTLSGNPLAMAAGLATLQEWSFPGTFEKAEAMCSALVQAMQEFSSSLSMPLVADSAGTMFGYFFQQGPVRNLEEAKGSNLEQFRRFFHNCLSRGVYFAPSQFEAGFVSQSHAGEALDYTLTVVENGLRSSL